MAQTPDRLSELMAMAKAGAPDLALQLMDREQGAPASNPDWVRWEQARIALFAAKGRWDDIERRLAQVDDPALAAWTLEQRAVAQVEAGRGTDARALLTRLFWTSDQADATDFARWQRLLTRSYLIEGRAGDALVVMARYGQDSAVRDEDRLLAAKVFLQSGRTADAEDTLADLTTPEAQALRLFARLRRGEQPRAILKIARQYLDDKTLPEPHRPLFYAAMAEAAIAASDYPAQVLALEDLLSHQEAPLLRGLSDLGPQDLWHAYLGYARVVAVRDNLPVGNDERWFAEAASARRMYPVKARSLFAWLAHNAPRKAARERAHQALLEHFVSRKDGPGLIHALYLSGGPGEPAVELPGTIRQALFDSALKGGDIVLASQLAGDTDAPPPDVSDAYEWRLRRARILLLGGRRAAAVEAVTALTPPPADTAPERADQLVQLLFDLQSIGEHEVAYTLFERMLTVVQGQPRRELLYWMADSRSAQGRHGEAAALYLRSAVLEHADAMDPWAQTARYQAAQALVKAGLREDAEKMLRQLLAATEDPARRAVLGREIEQLYLARAAGD